MNASASSPLSGTGWFALLALVLGNLYPIAGVYLFGWNAFEILILFWAENLVIGVFVMLKLATRATAGGEGGSAVLIPFFALHYGGFCLGHGLMLLSWFAPPELKPPRYAMEFVDFVWPLFVAVERIPGLKLSLAVLAVGQAVMFVMRFLLPREYLRQTGKALMIAPYPRILMLHAAMLFGAAIARKFGEPAIAVVVLILIKTAGEVALFFRRPRG